MIDPNGFEKKGSLSKMDPPKGREKNGSFANGFIKFPNGSLLATFIMVLPALLLLEEALNGVEICACRFIEGAEEEEKESVDEEKLPPPGCEETCCCFLTNTGISPLLDLDVVEVLVEMTRPSRSMTLCVVVVFKPP
uniref:Uncharacterized protein n=1 Tax=Naegleria fowleri TaxID=5763 RepID=M1H5V4_NAEFO|nr:hypothetical protein [Naegleria fowleri]